LFRIPAGLARRNGAIDLQTSWVEGLNSMPYYIALIHKEADSRYGGSFPDVPGVVTGADSIDAAMQRAAEILEFAAEGWSEQVGTAFPRPRTIDELRSDAEFQEDAVGAVIAAVPLGTKAVAAE
jgi:predicted RNase H-like HicB family nuclease